MSLCACTSLQVRDKRPNRERTMDEVEKQLLNQQQLIRAFVEKVSNTQARACTAGLGRTCLDSLKANPMDTMAGQADSQDKSSRSTA